MVTTRLEVKKTVVLEFSLPGVAADSSSYSGSERQLENRGHRESWNLRVDQENALATADVFAALAKAIRESMERP